MAMTELLESILAKNRTAKSKYQVVETTDLRTLSKSYKIFRRGTTTAPIAIGIATRAEAEAKARDLEAQGK